MQNTTTFEKIIASIPAGLDRIILMVLKQGRQSATGRGSLITHLDKIGYRLNERQLRQAIHDLRRDGHLICSAPGEDGGYYLAASHEEFLEFCNRELHPKAMDLLETERAMKASARRVWGDAVQLSLMG